MTDNAVDKAHEPPPSPAPPRGPRTATVLGWIIFGVIMLVAGAASAGLLSEIRAQIGS